MARSGKRNTTMMAVIADIVGQPIWLKFQVSFGVIVIGAYCGMSVLLTGIKVERNLMSTSKMMKD